MRTRNLILGAVAALSAILCGCGGGTQSIAPPANNPGGSTVVRPTTGGMPVASPDNFTIGDDGKIVSNLYYKFFADAVNESSGGRWAVFNYGGQKQWTLSNTANSSPKAWLLGGNYWNNEEDSLLSNSINILDGTDGIRLTFWSRWKIASGDSCGVYWWTDGTAQLVTTFTAGQNPDYPGWTKYYYELPANTSGFNTNNNVEFYFTSNSSGNEWGVGIDNVAVYQRQLEPPTDFSASDGNFSIDVTWNYPDTGTLHPDAVDIYRSTTSGSGYVYQDSVNYPSTIWADPSAAPNVTYYYVALARKAGYQDSQLCLEDSGFYSFGP